MAGKTRPWGNLTQVLETCSRKELLHAEASSSELEEFKLRPVGYVPGTL